MNNICQNFLPICPWEEKVTSRLPGIQPLGNLNSLYIQDDVYNLQMAYRDYLISEKRSKVYQLNNKEEQEEI